MPWNSISHFAIKHRCFIYCYSLFHSWRFFYHGVGEKLFRKYSLQSIGWLKPFVIGFTSSGLVTLYPVMFSAIEKGIVFELSWLYAFLFIKNMMFISVLCIMFDVKDLYRRLQSEIKNICDQFRFAQDDCFHHFSTGHHGMGVIPCCCVHTGIFYDENCHQYHSVCCVVCCCTLFIQKKKYHVLPYHHRWIDVAEGSVWGSRDGLVLILFEYLSLGPNYPIEFLDDEHE